MSAITKERIELFIKNPLDNGLTRGEQMELARIALASLEAKPIGAFHIAEQQVDGTSDYIKDGEWPIDNGTIEVYAAPPVPVVPEEKPMPNPLSMYAVDAVAAIAEVRGWNSCRAAMLHGAEPVSQTYKLNELSGNSPVTPDGWISCSERMPNTKTAVLVAVEFDRKGDWRMKWATYIPGHPDANDGWIIPGASWKPSHWMPLPEPPL
ncbi:DUF551 domain-containing protein [Escherichia coli]|nr:DUF551 domain-containing protein [Escherichia coli]HCO5573510.1 DUF551 domain-containing protein [Escherichia fergusonii]EGR9211319.1 DUF551 domain-containing protein [Escherichia coli]KAB3182915.1 DUF551 domain-containing protein [Escherichia coli]KAB3186239.1 DUF551 domain-containing protein [Escherichia coli]